MQDKEGGRMQNACRVEKVASLTATKESLEEAK